MKKILALVVLLAILATTAASADKLDVEHVDLTSLSFDELTVLQWRLSDELVSRPEWFGTEVPAGIWTVGVDIPARAYSVELVGEIGVSVFRVWGAKIDDYSTNGGLIHSVYMTKDNNLLGKIVLEEGYVLELSTPFKFAPPLSLGF